VPEILDVQGVSRAFGGVRAVDDVSFDVTEGEIFGIIGPNGAGKSTLFSLIAGSDRADAGRISALGRRIDRMSPFRRSRLGLGRTFQSSQVFGESDIRDNLRMAGVEHAARLTGQSVDDRVADVLELVGLADRGDKQTKSLPILDLQKLAIAMAIMGRPEILLLDEPSGGLVEQEVEQLASLLQRVRSSGCTLVVIDHKMRLMTGVCDRILAMASGRTLRVGTPQEVVDDERVRTAYLGRKGEPDAPGDN